MGVHYARRSARREQRVAARLQHGTVAREPRERAATDHSPEINQRPRVYLQTVRLTGESTAAVQPRRRAARW
jgi:hypothetical protein